MSSRHIYVDETKQKDYLLVASVHVADDIDTVRGIIRDLLLPGQRYLHMKDENDGRKRTIAAALVAADIKATVYRAGSNHRTHNQRRAACLDGLIQDHTQGPETLLVIDRDDTLVNTDRKVLYQAVRTRGRSDSIHYEHRSNKTELLLAVPDAIAWCWAKGGEWRTLIRAAVSEVREV